MPPSASVVHPATLRRESIRQIPGLRACGNDMSTPKYFGVAAVPARIGASYFIFYTLLPPRRMVYIDRQHPAATLWSTYRR